MGQRLTDSPLYIRYSVELQSLEFKHISGSYRLKARDIGRSQMQVVKTVRYMVYLKRKEKRD